MPSKAIDRRVRYLARRSGFRVRKLRGMLQYRVFNPLTGRQPIGTFSAPAIIDVLAG